MLPLRFRFRWPHFDPGRTARMGSGFTPLFRIGPAEDYLTSSSAIVFIHTCRPLHNASLTAYASAGRQGTLQTRTSELGVAAIVAGSVFNRVTTAEFNNWYVPRQR
jgi:hypothetical protein